MKIKRLLGVLLCMLLCMGLMSTMAFAADDPVITNLTATRDSETTATICGYKKAAVEIPATGDSEEPDTDDSANIAVWALLCGVSAIGAYVTTRARKEKTK